MQILVAILASIGAAVVTALFIVGLIVVLDNLGI